jgi:hypothetical protein
MKIIDTLKQIISRRTVVLDSSDNSVTLSRRLYRHIEHNLRQGKVFVFRAGNEYGFTLNLPTEPTQVNDLQYNIKYKSVGFETLCPTVNRILYDYNLPLGKHRLRVTHNPKFDYYIIHQP